MDEDNALFIDGVQAGMRGFGRSPAVQVRPQGWRV